MRTKRGIAVMHSKKKILFESMKLFFVIFKVILAGNIGFNLVNGHCFEEDTLIVEESLPVSTSLSDCQKSCQVIQTCQVCNQKFCEGHF